MTPLEEKMTFWFLRCTCACSACDALADFLLERKLITMEEE